MSQKQIVAVILDIMIISAAGLCLFLLYSYAFSDNVKQIMTVLIVLPSAALMGYELVCRKRQARAHKKSGPEISTLVLLGEGDRPIKVWDLTGKTGLLIGKSSKDYQVDIDLLDTDYHTYIDPEHAILNYHETGWWIQDTSSRNGISIIRNNKSLMPGNNAPVRLGAGDVIVIAQYTKIAVG